MLITVLRPVVRYLDNGFQMENLYPVDNATGFPNTYPALELSVRLPLFNFWTIVDLLYEVCLQFCQTSLLSGHLPIKKDQTIKCQMDRMSFLNGDPMSTNVSNEKRHAYCHGQTFLLVSDKLHIAGVAQ